MYGFAGYTPINEDTLPIPNRLGYKFNGWHHHNPQGVECTLELWPSYDIILYADWIEVGYSNNFDKTVDEKLDINAGMEVFKPGIDGYNPKYVNSGWRSLHSLANSDVAPRFLMFYGTALEVGQEYQIDVWMTTDQAEAVGKLYIQHGNYADVNADILGYEEVAEYSLKDGEWKQFTFKVIANGTSLFFGLDKGVSVFFEDVSVVPTGASGEVGNIIGYTPDNVVGEPNDNTVNNDTNNANDGIAIWLIAVIAGGAILVIGAVIVIVIVASKKKKSA